ncbi:MAG: sigma-70 family RNA polymerase sigma factor [Bacteroidales bacterium]|nr:sigma-70 family RNA polymerase sigma factor [Bacteroidales bacterium]
MHLDKINNDKYLKNDSISQKLLYNHFSPKMYGICLRFAKNIMEADDILQEGFIRVFTNLKYFRNEGSLEAWIRRTIINTAINYYRKNLKYTKEKNIDDIEISNVSEENVINRMSLEELLKIIQQLPNGYRTIFNLNVIEGYTHKEIGKMLNISDNTSKSQLTRAKSILRKKIQHLHKEKVKIPFEEMHVIKKDNKYFSYNQLLQAV